MAPFVKALMAWHKMTSFMTSEYAGVDWAAGTPGRFPVGRQDRWY